MYLCLLYLCLHIAYKNTKTVLNLNTIYIHIKIHFYHKRLACIEICNSLLNFLSTSHNWKILDVEIRNILAFKKLYKISQRYLSNNVYFESKITKCLYLIIIFVKQMDFIILFMKGQSLESYYANPLSCTLVINLSYILFSVFKKTLSFQNKRFIFSTIIFFF